ncbi:methyltransferase family protein [Bacteroidota bacterium]
MKTELKVKKHDNRPDLTGEHPFGDLGQLILLILFILIWVADIFFIKLSETEFLNVPLWINIPIGVFILLTGFLFASKSMKTIFGIKKDKPEIVQEKIYNKVRHPMYLGAILFYLGITLIMFSLPLAIMFVIIFLFYNFIAQHEEKLLVNQFGDDYKFYMKKVRRWIPKI